LIAVIGVFAYVKGVSFLKDTLSGPEDYTGEGSGSVIVEVQKGATITDIAGTLADADVVKSTEAFIEAAADNPEATSIQAGLYDMRKQMSAQSAVELMLATDPNEVGTRVTIPEGRPSNEVLDAIAEQTDFSRAQLQKAYDNTQALGLPAYANDNPEGYLFPATYQVKPDMTATDLLSTMVDEFKKRADAMDLEGRAQALGMSPHDIVTVASLIQGEARHIEDMPKVASVTYNRLDIGMRLQFDSTNRYAVDTLGVEAPGGDIIDIDSPYNSYDHTGLPPSPINNPGEDALEAALNPADTDYLYFVTVNLKTGETKFAETLAEHEQNVAEYQAYCETSDAC
jgi:UPF0755 protein